VNVHPAKTEVRFRRAAAVADSVREAVRAALASAGYAPAVEPREAASSSSDVGANDHSVEPPPTTISETPRAASAAAAFDLRPEPQQERIAFATARSEMPTTDFTQSRSPDISQTSPVSMPSTRIEPEEISAVELATEPQSTPAFPDLPPLDSAIKFVR